MRSEDADVTGIVKYIGKSVFWHQNMESPKFLFGVGGWGLWPLCSAAYAVEIMRDLDYCTDHFHCLIMISKCIQ